MMSVFSAEESELFEREVARFVANSYDAGRRKELVENGEFGHVEWKSLGDLGWLSIGIPESFGGMGGGLYDQLTVLREAGKGLMLEPLVSTLIVGAGLIDRLGTEQQRRYLLPKICCGELTIGFAHTPTGVGDTGIDVVSRLDLGSGCFVLSGTKRAVLHGQNVDLLLVTARDELDKSLQFFLVEPDAQGIQWHAFRMIDDRMAGDMNLHAVSVTRDARVWATSADDALRQILSAAAIATAAESVGAMEALCAMTLEYMKVRKQFGRTLGSFQVLQHRIVDMLIATKKAAALVKMAASAYDAASDDFMHLASACKAVAAKSGRFVGEQSIQIHGGIGMTDEYMAGHYLKRLLLLGACFGDADFHLQAIADNNHRAE